MPPVVDALAALSALRVTPAGLLRELTGLGPKLATGADNLARIAEGELAIATTPKDEVFREDQVRLYRYRPLDEAPAAGKRRIPVLIANALIGRFEMIDLQEDRSLVRKLLRHGLDVYAVDWGYPGRAERWLTIDDYVNGYLDACVDAVRERSGADAANLLGICQGGVFSACYAALNPEKVENLILTVAPLDFHADRGEPAPGSGYMNLWARSLAGDDVDRLIDDVGNIPGSMVGLTFLMMNPVGNAAKYTTDLAEIAADRERLVHFLRMERWIADRAAHPGEVARQWVKDLYQGNKLVRNELELGGRRVDLGRVRMPVLNIYARGDVIVPPPCSRGLAGRLGTSDLRELQVPGGHIGVFVGGKAQTILAPAIAQWLEARA